MLNLAAMRVHDVQISRIVGSKTPWVEGYVTSARRDRARVHLPLRADREVDISIFQAGDRDNLETSHGRAGWIRAVSRGRYKANNAMGFVARSVILADRQQARVFALRSGIRLQ